MRDKRTPKDVCGEAIQRGAVVTHVSGHFKNDSKQS